ncbi:hypothetical protein SNEBB_009843 [Seison nebaliae]|nr:hypothetical protein SNEBB_009843 [Seison nebaliae]
MKFFRFLFSVKQFDVIVVGGGHAGCESAAAATRMNRRTLLITQDIEKIGEMSCNPSFGGIGKGHLMMEIDALDGIIGRVCDKGGIHFKMLNRSRGPAVHGPRAQMDRKLFKKYMQEEMMNHQSMGLQMIENEVKDLLIKNINGKLICEGIQMKNNEKIFSKSTIITTGTFLNGEIFIGNKVRNNGRLGQSSSNELAQTFYKLKFEIGRLKTGTPPRIVGSSIDLSGMIEHKADNLPKPFSYLNDKVLISPSHQLSCYLTQTKPELSDIVEESLDENLHVTQEVTGPRYCPSIESKILKFPQIKKHQIWMEPEGFDTDLYYPQGLSCTMNEKLQDRVIRSVDGCERAEIAQYGYGVQYDFIHPTQLKRNLETRKVKNLFLAGQINGTTGYEEAAAQGIIAGINGAIGSNQSTDFFNISRVDGYIGVMIDDLTTRGTIEPYRMFTSRSEFRLSFRPDNADERLTELGERYGCVSTYRLERYYEQKKKLKKLKELLKNYSYKLSDWLSICEEVRVVKNVDRPKSAYDLFKDPKFYSNQLILSYLKKKLVNEEELKLIEQLRVDRHLLHRLSTSIIYERLEELQANEMQKIKDDEKIIIPENFNYTKLHPISMELREKLNKYQPQSLAAASHIPGMTPAALLNLLQHLKMLKV